MIAYPQKTGKGIRAKRCQGLFFSGVQQGSQRNEKFVSCSSTYSKSALFHARMGTREMTESGNSWIEIARQRRRARVERSTRIWKNPAYRLRQGVARPGHTVPMSNGYVMVKSPSHARAYADGYVLEHLIVWENEHKAPLPKGFLIHHRNGNRSDNDPENLEAMSYSEHTAFHLWLRARHRQPSKIALKEWRAKLA